MSSLSQPTQLTLKSLPRSDDQGSGSPKRTKYDTHHSTNDPFLRTGLESTSGGTQDPTILTESSRQMSYPDASRTLDPETHQSNPADVPSSSGSLNEADCPWSGSTTPAKGNLTASPLMTGIAMPGRAVPRPMFVFYFLRDMSNRSEVEIFLQWISFSSVGSHNFMHLHLAPSRSGDTILFFGQELYPNCLQYTYEISPGSQPIQIQWLSTRTRRGADGIPRHYNYFEAFQAFQVIQEDEQLDPNITGQKPEVQKWNSQTQLDSIDPKPSPAVVNSTVQTIPLSVQNDLPNPELALSILSCLSRSPVSSKAELDILARNIENPLVRTRLVTQLKGIGGNSLEHLVRKIMSYLMTKKVGKLFNFRGRGEKTAFDKYGLMRVILEAVQVHYPQATEFAMQETIMSWLKNCISDGRDQGIN